MEDQTTDELLAQWETVRYQEEQCQEMRGRLEWVLQQRMEGEGITELPHALWSVTLRAPAPVYETTALYSRLGELLPPEVLKNGYLAEHTKVVEARFDGTKVRSWRKYGAEVREAIDACKSEGRAILKIARKK